MAIKHNDHPPVIVLTRQPENYSCQCFTSAAARLGIGLELVDPHSYYLQLQYSTLGISQGGVAKSTGQSVIPRLSSLATEYSLAALRQLELCGAKPLNSYQALMRLRFKFTALGELAAAGIAVPDTEMLRAPSEIAPAVERLGGYPLVLKFLRGNQGVGVVYAPDESTVQSVLEAMNLVAYDVMLQRYYPDAAKTDIRVLVLNGEARWAVRRESSEGRFRSNFHRGGSAAKLELASELAELAVNAASVFELGFAGVDIIESETGLLVLEVNASPGFETVDIACGEDVAGEVLAGLAEL